MAAKKDSEAPTIGVIGTLNLKKLGCDPTLGKEKEVALAQIYGFVNGIKVGINPRDQSTMIALVGEFQGVNLATGEIMRSGRMFLPGGIHESLTGPYVALKDGDDVPELRFGYTIYSYPSTAPAGYSYKAIPFEKAAENDRLNELGKLALAVGIEQKTLPAPKK